MYIKIELKQTATLSRIEELGRALECIGDGNIHTDEFGDVIDGVSMDGGS